MEKLYEYVKNCVVNFKLDRCCFVAPVRIGLFIIGYFNIFIALISLVGTADNDFTPPLMSVQAVLIDGDPNKPLGILAYSAEMGFNSLLLCGIYRNDMVLLRVYICFVVAQIISTLLVYSIVFATITLLKQLIIVSTLIFQCYIIILVRSAIVEIKQKRSSEKNGHVTLYSVVQTPEDPPKSDKHADVEVAAEPEPEHQKADEAPHPELKPHELPTKLETVNENSKEE